MIDGDGARALAGAEFSLSEIGAKGAILDGKDGGEGAFLQEGKRVGDDGESFGLHEGLGGVLGSKEANIAGDETAIDFEGEAFHLKEVAMGRHLVDEPIREVGGKSHQMQIGKQKDQQEKEAEEDSQNPTGGVTHGHEEERRKTASPRTAFRLRDFRCRIHGAHPIPFSLPRKGRKGRRSFAMLILAGVGGLLGGRQCGDGAAGFLARRQGWE